MTLKENNNHIPGGRTALNLFWLGGAMLFVSGLLVVLNVGDTRAFYIGTYAWIFPVWGAIAVIIALVLRKTVVRSIKFLGMVWLGVGIALLAMVIFAVKFFEQ